MSISNVYLGYNIVYRNTNSGSSLLTTGVLNSKSASGSTVTGSWTCPAGVYKIDVVCIGGGGGGGYGNASSTNYNFRVGGNGGGGGGLGWKRGISVIPGQSYSYQVGAGVAGPVSTSTRGGDSWFISTSTVFGGGGQSGGVSNSPGYGGSFAGEGGGNGGKGGHGLRGWAISTSGGGGGAGGYYGDGGHGGNAIGNWVPGVIITYRSTVTITLASGSGPYYYNMTNIPTGTSSNPSTGYPYEYVGIGGAIVGGTLWSSISGGSPADFGTVVSISDPLPRTSNSASMVFSTSSPIGSLGTYIGIRGSGGWDGSGGAGGGGGGAGNLKSSYLYSTPTAGSGGGGTGVQGNLAYWSSNISTGGVDYINNTYNLNSKAGAGGQYSNYASPNTFPLSGYPGYGGYGQSGGIYSYNYQIGGRQGSLAVGGNFGGGGGGGSSYTNGAGAISSGGNGAVFIKWNIETLSINYVGGAAYSYPGGSTQTVPLNQLTGGLASTPAIGDIVIVGYAMAGATNHDLTMSSAGWTRIQVPSPAGFGTYVVGVGYPNNSIAYVSSSQSYKSFTAYYKFMEGTVDSSFDINPSGSLVTDSIAISISVFSNVNSVNTNDNATKLAANPYAKTLATIFGDIYFGNSGVRQSEGYDSFLQSDGITTAMPEVRPLIEKTVVLTIAAGKHSAGEKTYKCDGLGGFVSAGYNNNYDISIGAGWRLWDGWLSGAYSAPPFVWNDGSSLSGIGHTWSAVSITLRPA